MHISQNQLEIGLTTSFADVNDETLLIQQISNKVHSQVSIEADGSARIAGQDGQLGTADDVFVRPGANGQAPHVDQFGNVTVPTGGCVELPDGNIVWDTGNDQSIVVPGGTVITPNGNGGAPVVNADGSVKIPDGSMIVLPIGSDITLPSGSSVSGNGDAITAGGVSIKADGTTIIPGADGQIGTADDVIVKPDIQPNVYIELPSIDKFGNVKVQDGSKVVSSNGNTINVQNESVVSINGIITQPDGSIIDSNGNNNQGGDVDNSGENVTNPDENNKPGEDTNKPDENVTNPGGNTNKPTESVTKPSVSAENPNTGDRSVMGMLVLGSMALLALVKNLKIKDKLFLKQKTIDIADEEISSSAFLLIKYNFIELQSSIVHEDYSKHKLLVTVHQDIKQTQ